MDQEIKFPSGPLLEKSGKAELDAYREWFIGMVQTRPAELTRFVCSTPGFEHWSCDYSVGSLTVLEQWLSARIKSSRGPHQATMEPLTRPSDLGKYLDQPGLTDRTYSVLFDCGFYLGEMLRQGIPGADWFQIGTGRRKSIDFGHVVLGPFETYNFNPIRLMTSKGFAHVDLPDRERSLSDIFSRWKEKTVVQR